MSNERGDGPRRVRVRKWSAAAAAAVLVAGAAFAVPAIGAVDTKAPSSLGPVTGEDGREYLVTVDAAGEVVARLVTAAPSPTATTTPTSTGTVTTAPTTTTSPTSTAAALNVQAVPAASSITVTWNRDATGVTVARDGVDKAGTGAWKSAAGVTSPFTLTNLVAGQTYTVTVAGTLQGRAVSQAVRVLVPATTSPTTTAAPSPTTSVPPTTVPPTSTPPSTIVTPPSTIVTRSGKTWMSGSAAVGVQDTTGLTTGTNASPFAAWRGANLDIASTWADGDAGNQRELYALFGDYGGWNAPVDVAVGALVQGETWAQAKNPGTTQDRWRAGAKKLATWTAANPNRVAYVRFAHEMNGNWYSWKVTAATSADFIDAWRDYATILRAECGTRCKLVFNVNRESVASGIDWRKTFPGAAYVDVMGVDYYNQYPVAKTAAEFVSQSNQVDGYGGPKGIAAHLAFAKSVGLPLSVSEWSSNANSGDYPGFIEGMHTFFRTNAGSGAGQFLYDVQFNESKDGTRWQLYPNTRAPLSAAKYRELF